MKLSDYLRPLAMRERERLAVAAGTTLHHLKNVAFSGKPCGEKLAVALEMQTRGSVRRWESRASDWWEIWPELIGADGAPAVPEGRSRPVLDAAAVSTGLQIG